MPKKLLIVSHTEHYQRGSKVVGWGPTIREISHLATLFDEVVHVAPLHAGKGPASCIGYDCDHIRHVAVKPAGGASLSDKLGIIATIPQYARAILRELSQADVVHVRCPANISLVALLLLAFTRKPRVRWIKYAGNWQPDRKEAWSYTFQRWWLKRNFARAKVTVNGEWPHQPAHIHPFLNPCLTDDEINDANCAATDKNLTSPLQLVFVGRLEDAKGVSTALQVAAKLHEAGIPFVFDLIGDGPARQDYERWVAARSLDRQIIFHGWLPRPDLAHFYSQAHFLLLPTYSSEGWPKVISEAMAYGVVPIAGAVSSIPQYLKRFETGRAITPEDSSCFFEAIVWYTQNPAEWKREAQNAATAAQRFTYSSYLSSVRKLLGIE